MNVGSTGHLPEPGWARGRRWWEDAVDRLAGSDPGLNRFRMASQAVTSIGAALGAEYAFVKGTGALQRVATTPAQAPAVAAGNHALLVIAMLLGAMIGLVTSMSIADTTPRRLLVSYLLVPGPIVATMALGLVLGGHRSAALASFALLLGIGGLARRWGPRGSMLGNPLFFGDFIGFFLYGVVSVGDLGWLSAELGVGLLACLAVRFTLFFPDPAAALRRSQRSWVARADRVARLAADDFLAPGDHRPGAAGDRRRARRLQRQLNRLNEASLIIDAQLVEPGALPVGSSARRLHERLFEAELGLTNTARFAAALRDVELPAKAHQGVTAALVALRDGDTAQAAALGHQLLDDLASTAVGELADPAADVGGPLRRQRVLVHRFASSIALLGDALEEWLSLGASGEGVDPKAFVPAVRLASGWLPGSAEVSATASASPGGRWGGHLALPPYVRSAVQVGVAVAVATAAGDAVSGRRFYWAVIAAFVAFYGANNSLEQVRKSIQRVAGTVIGIFLGSLIAAAIGRNVPWGVATILGSLFFGLYLFRLSYSFLVIAITVMVSQLYEQLDEFSHSLLLLRLLETTIGAAAAVLTVLLVLPLRTTRVFDVALGSLLLAVRELVADAVDSIVHGPQPSPLAERARAVDSAFQSLESTARPLRHVGDAGRRAQRVTVAAGALRHYCRNLSTDMPATAVLPCLSPALVDSSGERLLSSLDGLLKSIDEGATATYVRSASQWNSVEQRALDELRRVVASGAAMTADVVAVMLAARDLQLLDGALAEIAQLQRIPVEDLDTTAAVTVADPRRADLAASWVNDQRRAPWGPAGA